MMYPMKVGIREAKINFSKLIKSVQEGLEVIITDRGKPVGKIVPVPVEFFTLEERLGSLERIGLIEPAQKNCKRLPPPLPLPGEWAQKFLQESRNK